MDSWDTEAASPWHAGEVALHRRMGVETRMEETGRRAIRDHMPEQHRLFFPLLPFVVLGAVDPGGDPWATLRAGAPGFVSAPDPAELRIDIARDAWDPAETGLEDGDAVAVLGIDPATRRRNRLNGTVRRSGGDGFSVGVAESFGNCPRYIHRRIAGPPLALRPPAPPEVSETLDGRARALLATADTLFVATAVTREDGRRQVDVSHRGGAPGFVSVGRDGAATVPDYAGNLFFNTLGNMLVDPRVGIAVLDGGTGDLLQMTGRGEVVLDGPEIARHTGAERLWRFLPRRVVFRAAALPLRFTDLA